jgi:hypothetical protein
VTVAQNPLSGGAVMVEFFYETQLTIPLVEFILLLFFSTLALLFGKVKIALIINYVFAMYWGYILNRDTLFASGYTDLGTFSMVYFGFGILITALALVSFYRHTE